MFQSARWAWGSHGFYMIISIYQGTLQASAASIRCPWKLPRAGQKLELGSRADPHRFSAQWPLMFTSPRGKVPSDGSHKQGRSAPWLLNLLLSHGVLEDYSPSPHSTPQSIYADMLGVFCPVLWSSPVGRSLFMDLTPSLRNWTLADPLPDITSLSAPESNPHEIFLLNLRHSRKSCVPLRYGFDLLSLAIVFIVSGETNILSTTGP